VVALTRDISDHTPLLLNIGQSSSNRGHSMFKFELGWLLREGFAEMVQEIWSRDYQVTDPMQKLQTKIRRLRQHLRGWSKNVSGAYKKEKNNYWIN
jgi:hypothetical protein